MKYKKDLIGRNVGKLTILEFSHYREYKGGRKSAMWKCVCECGNIRIINRASLTNKKRPTKSCGCLLKDFYEKIKQNPINTNTKEKGEGAFNSLFYSYKARAKKKNIEFTLTKDEFKLATKENCHYCGVEPRQNYPKTNTKYNGTYLYNGLDRKDNNKGYTKQNIRTSCTICNKAKRDLTYSEFIDWLDRLRSNFLIVDLD